jgi:hypothetical protein
MSVRKALAAAGIVTLSIAGGAVGATLFGTANADTPSPSPTTESGTTGAPHSNEDPAHEAGESAEREAAENEAANGGTTAPAPTATLNP